MIVPDKWIMVKITVIETDEVLYKIFASWHGGFMGSNSWRMNSGVTKVTEDDKFFYFEGHSGSLYQCDKQSYGSNPFCLDVLKDYIDRSKHLADMQILRDNTKFMEINYGSN